MTDPQQTPEGKAYDSNEDLRPHREGGAPRPASDPVGSEGSANNAKTATDPSTGQPNGSRRP